LIDFVFVHFCFVFIRWKVLATAFVTYWIGYQTKYQSEYSTAFGYTSTSQRMND